TIPKDATGYGLSAHCLALYTLAVAGQAEPAYHEFLFKKRSGLTSEDRALLALAIIESGGPGQMLQELLLAGPTGYAENAFGSAARENAMQLLAWLRYRPSSPLIDQLALELFSRRQNGHWSTTQGNAWSLLALGNYLREMEQGDKQVTGMVEWAGQKQPFALSEKEKSARTIFPIAPATAHEPIKLLKTTGGPLFSEVTIEAWPRVIEQPRQDRGFAIERRYEKLEDDGKVSPLATPRVGDLILITLTIVTRGRSTFVAVEDPLPAVLAAINPAFESQETIAGEQPETSWVSDYSELRKDRALFFADQLNPGRYILRYLARVVAAGKATAPAAKIEQMYHPERFGTSGTLKVEALPLKAP
ncbi:MAG: hypothetical protein V4710_18210, partial [Verrucomicrobiota bacterium]